MANRHGQRRGKNHVSKLCLSPSSFFSRRLSVPRFLLSACASLCCPCLTEVDVDGEMRRLVGVLYLHLFFHRLKASVS